MCEKDLAYEAYFLLVLQGKIIPFLLFTLFFLSSSLPSVYQAHVTCYVRNLEGVTCVNL
jgi:hypothetical protein